MLAAIAVQTTGVERGCSYRNPNLQADLARTIDHIGAGQTGVLATWAPLVLQV